MKLRRTLPEETLSALCLNYAMMLKAGIQADEATSLLLEGASLPDERALLTQLSAALSQGASLGEAMERTGRFPPFMIQMLAIGHATGRMEGVLSSLSQFYQREGELKTALKNTVTYPVVMLAVVCAILLALVWQVLPVFAGVYQDLGAELPAAAQLFMTLGSISRGAAVVFALLCLAIILLLALLGLTEGGRRRMARGADRLFFHGQLTGTVSRSRFASVMSLMLSSGLPMDECLDRAKTLLRDDAFSTAIETCREAMLQGTSFPQAAREAGIFQGVAGGILAAGFQAGSMTQALQEMAQRYQTKADGMLTRVMGRSEPIFVVVLACAVGLVLLSVMLPLLGMLNSIGL